jgi:pimeloyl-ACP methyl ester carboxylesterase
MHEHPRITFGPFVLNPGTGTLLRHGVPVPLGYRALLLLTAFLDRPGEVLTKSDLINAAWDGAAVEETNLSVQIASLRKHLGQAPEGGDWIATIHRVGYRFVGPLQTEGRPYQEASAAASRIEKPLSRTSPAAPIPQQIHYCAAPDGVRIAYAAAGEGYPLLKCANWMSDLQYDWDSSVWRHWIAELSDRNRLIRYDQRGNGLSDRVVEDLSFAAQLSDLETVADMACPERFALLGISAGAAVSVAYAARHPKRVSRLILYGGRPRGWKHSGTQAYQAQRAAMSTLIREGWGQDNPAFRQMFTSLFIPDATPEQMHWYNELQRRTVTPENAARLDEHAGDMKVTDLLGKITVPTLVLHSVGDALVPFDLGRELAITIPGARFVALDSRNHILLADEPAFARFLSEVRDFMGREEAMSPTGVEDADHV